MDLVEEREGRLFAYEMKWGMPDAEGESGRPFAVPCCLDAGSVASC